MDDGVAELFEEQGSDSPFPSIYDPAGVVIRGGFEAGTVIDGVSAPLRGTYSLYVNAPTPHRRPPHWRRPR